MTAAAADPSPAGRVAAVWRLKLTLSAVLSVAIVGGYGFLSHHDWGRPHPVPLTWLDGRVPYRPGWVRAYQSLYVITGVVPWLATTRRQVWRYAAGLAVLSAVAFATFAAWPTASPRPVGPPSPPLRLLFTWDGPYAAFPSLHAGYLVYALAAARPWVRPSAIVKVFMLGWAAVILYATLAIREHCVIDLVAGAALALVVDAVAGRVIG